MTTRYVKCSPSDTLALHQSYRITIGITSTLGRLAVSWVPGARAYNFQKIYDGIAQQGAFAPATELPPDLDETAVVIDCLTVSTAEGKRLDASVLAIVGSRSDYGVMQVERLASPDEITMGGAARDTARAQAIGALDIGAAVTGAAGTLTSGIGDTLKWSIIAVVVVVGVMLIRDLE